MTAPRRASANRNLAAGVRAPEGISRALLDWYASHRRELPWRETSDPYAVWVSEVMLQQTRVETVRAYYERWMQRFPTARALARASEQDVLHAWQGLGYYSRARNLWRGARVVVDEHGGELPRSVEGLRTLPGIGPYSAGAIASIAHGERTPLVDGNVVRVLCRLFALRGDPTRAPLGRELWRIAGELVPGDRPGDFNQALMELGATVCTPRAPDCARCPLRRACAARRAGEVDALPELPARAPAIAISRVAAIVRRGEKVLAVQVRADAPRWAGMWQFPNADVKRRERVTAAAARAVLEAVGVQVTGGEAAFRVSHSVTRFRISLDVVTGGTSRGVPRAKGCAAFVWQPPGELHALAMPAAHRKIADWLARA